MRQVSKSGLVWLSLALFALSAVDLLMGSIQIPYRYVIGALAGETNTYAEIIWQFRLPKALTCILAGSALSVSGLMMQTLFRNPLAGPDVLGLTSGSSLFVAAIILAGQRFPAFFVLSNPWIVAIAASAGAALVFVVIMTISRFVNDNTSLLIIGLMIGAATASIVGVLQFISKAEDLQAFMIWGLGNVGGTGWDEIGVLTVAVIAGMSLSFFLMKPLNSFLLGERYAQSLGIRVRRSRLLILTATCMMTGGVTAFCGPIAFVGLAVPHLVRLLQPTTNHKIMIPAVMLGGASLLLVCDMIAQLPGSTQVLPINAVTSLIGAPVVIWLIIRNKKVTV